VRNFNKEAFALGLYISKNKSINKTMT